MPSSGLPMLSNGSSRMDGTLSQSMDSVNTVAAEEEVNQIFLSEFLNGISIQNIPCWKSFVYN